MTRGNCTIDGCDKQHYAFGWCNTHYNRFRKHGDPLGFAPKMPLEDRLWPKIDKAGPIPEYAPHLGPCWIWNGSKDKAGYGRINIARVPMLVHRIVYELLIGPFPEGLEPDHLCRVHACVKVIADEFGPAHLEPVTHRENCLRGTRWP